MLFNKLTAMSMGSLWVLRSRGTQNVAHSQEANSNSEAHAVLAVLAEPMMDIAQQKVLENCIKAAGWTVQLPCFYLNASLPSDCQTVLDALQQHVVVSMPEFIIVFGHKTAQLIDAKFVPGQIHYIEGTHLIVTHHPSDMLSKPEFKAQVWADLCLLK